MGQTITIKAQLIEIRKSEYTVYVFANIDQPGEYVMCTLLPNWEYGEVDKGQSGFLTYKVVVAGEEWMCPKSYTYQKYKYSALYFDDFVPQTHIVDGNRIQEVGSIIIS